MVVRKTGVDFVAKGERRRAMANRVGFGSLVGGVAAAAVLLLTGQSSHAQVAQVASDRTAGYIVFPDVDVDTNDLFTQGRTIDTIIQLTNTASGCRVVQCIYVTATKHCNNAVESVCRVDSDCEPGVACGLATDCSQPELNFFLSLSAGQAVGWSAANGATLPLEPSCGGTDQLNTQPALAAPSGAAEFFEGELKCIEMFSADGTVSGASGRLLNSNDLKGEATIHSALVGTPGGLDVRAYNAIGIQATLNDGSQQAWRCVGGVNQGDACTTFGSTSQCPDGMCNVVACLGMSPAGVTNPVCPLGITTGTYAGCPAVLVLDHWFDGALNPVTGNAITTELVLVPCSEDVTSSTAPLPTTAQFLVFNEFEQRFSASMPVRCQRETLLSNIDVRPGLNTANSIFRASIQGTLTGQTRIRPVAGNEATVGHGLLGIAEEASGSTLVGTPFELGSAAFNLNYVGTITRQADTVTVSP